MRDIHVWRSEAGLKLALVRDLEDSQTKNATVPHC